MTSLISKLILYPFVVAIAAYMYTGLEFGVYYEPFLLGTVLATAATLVEFLLLKRGTFWMSTWLDLLLFTIGVYYITTAFPDTNVTFMGALFAGMLLTFIEYPIHKYLIRSGKTRKSE